MNLLERIAGLLYVAVAGATLYYFWPDLRGQLAGTWFDELYLIVAVVYVFAACWVFETIWARLLAPLVADDKRGSH